MTMADNTATHEDKDATAFFEEVEKEKKNDYETCSASQAFDAVFQCYSKVIVYLWLYACILTTYTFAALGSQAINYYRYGTKKDCSGKWEDFKFCLKTKTKSSEIADVSSCQMNTWYRRDLTRMVRPWSRSTKQPKKVSRGEDAILKKCGRLDSSNNTKLIVIYISIVLVHYNSTVFKWFQSGLFDFF